MELISVQNTEEHFQAFVAIEKEFVQHYVELKIGEQYGRILPEDLPLPTLKAEFKEYLDEKRGMFALAKESGEYVGYIAGCIGPMPRGYKIETVGTLSSMAVLPTYRGRGIGTSMRDAFFSWLRKEGVTMSHIYCKPENTDTMHLYEKWGFKTDEVRMWKKIN